MAGSAPHVLYVAWGFPPCRGGGVYRALATANGFVEAECDVTVLTATRGTFIDFTGADESLEQHVDERIDIVRLPFSWPSLEFDLRKWSALRAFAPRQWAKLNKRRDFRIFPERNYGPWLQPLQDAARAIHARRPVDLVVATANPNVDFMAARELHRAFGVPYVMDYRDAWMLDVFDGGLLHEEGGREDTLEQELLAGAHEVWFVNEPIRAWHAQRHPGWADKMHVVANGYDADSAPAPTLDRPPADAPLTFGYIGTASPKVPLEPFALGWEKAVTQARATGGDLVGAKAQLWGYLGFYSTPSPALLKLVEEHAASGLTYEGPVPKMEVKERYRDFDVALLILGTGRYVTSGKVFEYTASALPIVSVHDPGNAASDILRGYPLWFPTASLEPGDIAEAVTKAAHAARTADRATREACAEFSRQYERDRQLRPRIAALREFSRPTGTGDAVTAVTSVSKEAGT